MTNQELLTENEKLRSELSNTKIKYENTKLELDNLKRILFGSKREYTPQAETDEISEQCSIFDDEKDIEEDLQKQIEENIEEVTIQKKKKSKTKKAGIKKNQLKNVEIIKKEYVLNEDEKCPECQGELKVVSKKVVRQEIEYEPAKLKIVEYIQNVYKCKQCGTDKSKKETSTFLKPELPKPLLTHSFASPSLAAEVMYQKYYLGVPLYRQEKMWDDKGLVLPRNMMANWIIKISQYYLDGLYNLMLKKIKEECELAHCDETTLQCNKESGRKATSNSYMWVLRSGELEKTKGVIFRYSPSRSAQTAQNFLKGFQ